MLFVGVFKQKESSATAELITRRLRWEPGEGTTVLGEYWLQTNDPALPSVITIFKTANVAEILETVTAWDDVFDITVVPAVGAEEGLQLIQRMMHQQQGL